MPELSGRELLRQIQAKHPATPVIVISGLSHEADARLLMDLGAFAYFAKPFKLEDIEQAVERAIKQHAALMPTVLPDTTTRSEGAETNQTGSSSLE